VSTFVLCHKNHCSNFDGPKILVLSCMWLLCTLHSRNENCDPLCKNVFLECVDYVDGKRTGEIGNGDDMRKVV
jgi:hypothetical protein